ncbi:LOW QUALITY PROTEIN: uncharacterized protein ACR2FA_004030 [Aphomia sociella]
MYMKIALATLLVLQCCELCVTIRVPSQWTNRDNSEVQGTQDEFSVESFKPENQQKLHPLSMPIPVEYFKYTAKKPQFAVDIATFHGVQSPETHFKAQPVRPYTGREKPDLGKHHLQDKNREIYRPLQKFTRNEEYLQNHVRPVVSDYEVFHPYKAEEPALQELYKDPVLDKIRNDLRDTIKSHENYEKEEEKADIMKEEYLESPHQTDHRIVPHRNVPTQYEIHRPQRRPIYYRPLPNFHNRDQVLNRKFKHPWNQNYVKIRPVHYQPIKNNLQRLRQHHALTYDDERNEYPQVPIKEDLTEPSDGYDIYENGKSKYVQLRNNVDEAITNAVRENRPEVSQNLELQNNEQPIDDEEDEFVPVKNYAQVRKTETTKHLPREAAFDDADSYEEIRNAPRLKEAVKTTKAQTVYTEEGYEDSAYDHAGEQKHASNHEGHGGYLKEQEISGGKYKIPSVSGNFDNKHGSAYRDQKLHGEKWKNSDKNNTQKIDSEDYSDDNEEQSVDADIYEQNTRNVEDEPRNKREENSDSLGEISDENVNNMNTEHGVNKREANFKIPEINLNTTFLTEDEILKIAKKKIISDVSLKLKYPYYFKNHKTVHKDSPLRYAENLKLIPKKSQGGTEFYDSRSQLECSEVDEKVEAIPKKLNKKGHPDSVDDDGEEIKEEDEKENDPLEEKPRLNGLGDKIDCFKAKYFGENPLDSPFFKEEIIANPEPVTLPNIATFRIINDQSQKESVNNNIFSSLNEKFEEKNNKDVFDLIDKLRSEQSTLRNTLTNATDNLRLSLQSPDNVSINNNKFLQEATVYTDIIDNIKDNLKNITSKLNKSDIPNNLLNHTLVAGNNSNLTYESFLNKEDVTKLPTVVRKKRGAPFVYEPYKIIRDGQVQESKRTTTTSNISPLIKQLQSSKVVDKVTNTNQDLQSAREQSTKQNTASRVYKDIGKRDREQSKNSKPNNGAPIRFVNVNVDKRRGEPRYEVRPPNHKLQYTPVENKKAMSVEDYEAQTKNGTNNISKTRISRQKTSIARSINKSDSTRTDIQTPAASNAIKKTIANTTVRPKSEKKIISEYNDNDSSEEDYEEYDDDDDDEEEEVINTTTTTTTTTSKPIFKKIKTTTTTEKPEEVETEIPKLRLVTRFRNTPTNSMYKVKEGEDLNEGKYENDNDTPKYREKKKSSKSTLVTDTKTYGEDDDDMREEEVDALIGVKHDMKEYMPLYEKEAKRKEHQSGKSSEEDNSNSEDDEYDNDEDDDDDEDDEDEDEEEEEEGEESGSEVTSTTPEPTKRTLIKTTTAPMTTTQPITSRDDIKPIVTRKKIEIHKELPVNKSAPHVTQFKQDIKEYEIVKEIPRKISQKTTQKNLELLDLYKDENLAKNINKLGAVEVFKEDLDFKNGPRHGGNYKIAKLTEPEMEEINTPKMLHGRNLKDPKDAEASQSEYKKSIEFDDEISSIQMHGGNLKSVNDIKKSIKGSNKNAKLTDFSDTTEPIPRARHGGNLKSFTDIEQQRKKSEKLIELSDDDTEHYDDDDSTDSENFKFHTSRHGSRPMHGGNYKSARLTQRDMKNQEESRNKDKKTKVETQKDARAKAAVLLNSFAQAVPILTTTPAYILDPSKRMYYYVDA